MYLLDTNIVSYILYHPENYPYLMHKVRTTRQRDLYICMVTVGELVQWRLSGITKKDRQKYCVEAYRNLHDVLDDLGKMQI